jgi:photosystem II stability/assembly factor-like uncharacterized protein
MRKIFTIACFLFIASFQICISQWEECNNGLTNTNLYVNSLAINGNNIIIGILYGGIFLSTDNGNSWLDKNNGLTSKAVRSIFIDENMILIGTNEGIFISKDTANTWLAINNDLIKTYAKSIIINNDTIFAGTWGKGVYLSVDNGNTWNQKNNGLNINDLYVYSMAIKGNIIIIGTSGGICISKDNGNSWFNKNDITNKQVTAIAISGNNLYAGTNYEGIFLSSNEGKNWIDKNIGLNSLLIESIAISDSNIFVGTNGGGLFLSTNNGDYWIKKNYGLTNLYVTSISINADYIFIGTDGGVFRAKLSDLITDIPEKEKPNNSLSISPNPATNTITLNYPENILGEQVRIFNTMGILVWSGIADGNRKAIDVSQFPCGAYFMRVGDKTRIFVKE